VYPNLPANPADLLKLIDEHLAKRSKSFVEDGHVFARVIKEKLLPEIAELNRQVTSLQTGGTQLLQENRRLKRFRGRVSKLRRGRRLVKFTCVTETLISLPEEDENPFVGALCPACNEPWIDCPHSGTEAAAAAKEKP
jgi:hypothetical protein